MAEIRHGMTEDELTTRLMSIAKLQSALAVLHDLVSYDDIYHVLLGYEQMDTVQLMNKIHGRYAEQADAISQAITSGKVSS